jgi:hypothetical protein
MPPQRPPLQPVQRCASPPHDGIIVSRIDSTSAAPRVSRVVWCGESWHARFRWSLQAMSTAQSRQVCRDEYSRQLRPLLAHWAVDCHLSTLRRADGGAFGIAATGGTAAGTTHTHSGMSQRLDP